MYDFFLLLSVFLCFFLFFRRLAKINFSTNNKQPNACRHSHCRCRRRHRFRRRGRHFCCFCQYSVISYTFARPVCFSTKFRLRLLSVYLFYFSTVQLLQRVRHANYKIFLTFLRFRAEKFDVLRCAALFSFISFVRNWLLIRLLWLFRLAVLFVWFIVYSMNFGLSLGFFLLFLRKI